MTNQFNRELGLQAAAIDHQTLELSEEELTGVTGGGPGAKQFGLTGKWLYEIMTKGLEEGSKSWHEKYA
jgi:hypothetical protein